MYSAKRRFRLFRHPGWATGGGGGAVTYDTRTLSNDGAQEGYITKYTTSGRVAWAARVSGTLGQFCSGVSSGDGNIYVVGSLPGTSTLYNGNGTLGATVTGLGSFDCFLAKYSSDGDLVWVTTVAGTLLDNGIKVAIDASENIYITGNFVSSPLTIYNAGGGVTLPTLANSGGTDMYIVKYNSSGVGVWATRMVGLGVGPRNIAVDSAGNVYICGYYLSVLQIYNTGGGKTLTDLSANAQFTFLVKYNSSGIGVWALRFACGSTGYIDAPGLCLDGSDNVYLCGTYYTTTTFSNAGGGTTLASLTGNSVAAFAFIVKYNSSGIGQLRARVTSSDDAYAAGIRVDSSGNIYSYMYDSSTTSLSIQNTTNTEFVNLGGSAGTYRSFLVKYDSSGQPLWVARIDGAGDDFATGLTLDSAANVYVTGNYTGGTCVIYNALGTTTLSPLPLTATASTFIVKYDTNGVSQWATRLNGNDFVGSSSIAINDSESTLYMVGNYQASTLTLRSVGF